MTTMITTPLTTKQKCDPLSSADASTEPTNEGAKMQTQLTKLTCYMGMWINISYIYAKTQLQNLFFTLN